MNHHTNLSIAAILLSGAVLIHSVQSAVASMPVGMQHGQFPYEHFTECDLPGGTSHATKAYCTFNVPAINTSYTLLTVPSDRIFVVTHALSDNSDCNFTSGGTPLLSQCFIDNSYTGLGGNGHIVIPAGATLDVYLLIIYCPFYIEGYYAHL